jgi:hypothetical protein
MPHSLLKHCDENTGLTHNATAVFPQTLFVLCTWYPSRVSRKRKALWGESGWLNLGHKPKPEPAEDLYSDTLVGDTSDPPESHTVGLSL